MQLLQKFTRIVLLICLSVWLTACGGGSGSGSGSDSATTAVPILSLATKSFRFSWTAVSGATHYRLLENPDGISGFSQVDGDIPQGTEMVNHNVPLYMHINASYILQTCNGSDCTDSNIVHVSGSLVDAIGYFKASNTEAGDKFGYAVSLSDSGDTLAVGAPFEDSNAIGINGNQADNSAGSSGAAYIFTRNGNTWAQQAYIKASNTGAGDRFGDSLSLSDDGNTLAVGAWIEQSNASGINGNQADNSADYSGAVYVFTRSGTAWTQQAYVKASNTAAGDQFGEIVSLSGDGNTLAVGTRLEDSNATGINGNQTDNSANGAGAVYVFTRSGTVWSQQAYVKASNTEAMDWFGWAASLSGDGNYLAVGATRESSVSAGVNRDQTNNLAGSAGAVYVYKRTGNTWAQQAYVKSCNPTVGQEYGFAVSLSFYGNTLAVGAPSEDSSSINIYNHRGCFVNTNASNAGAVYVITRSGTAWSQQAYIKASNTDGFDWFGWTVSLSGDGDTLAVTAPREGSGAIGFNGSQTDNSTNGAGAMYVFMRSGSTWSQQAYVKSSNTEANDGLGGPPVILSGDYGETVSLSGDGMTLAVGTLNEDSIATGIGGNQTDNSAIASGATYLY